MTQALQGAVHVAWVCKVLESGQPFLFVEKFLKFVILKRFLVRGPVIEWLDFALASHFVELKVFLLASVWAIAHLLTSALNHLGLLARSRRFSRAPTKIADRKNNEGFLFNDLIFWSEHNFDQWLI